MGKPANLNAAAAITTTTTPLEFYLHDSLTALFVAFWSSRQ